MAREVELLHALRRNTVHVSARVESVVEAADEDIVDVEEDEAVGAPCYLAEEFPLCHDRLLVTDITRNILQQDAPAQSFLNLRHARSNMPYSFLGVGQGHQVMQVPAVHAGPAQVIGDPRGFDTLRQRL